MNNKKLNSVPLESFLSGRTFASYKTVHGMQTVQQAIEVLLSIDIISIPVVEREGSTEIIGFIGATHLAHHLLDCCKDVNNMNADKFFNCLVKDVMASHKEKLIKIDLSAKSTDLLHHFAQGAHRVLICDGQTQVGVLSQSDVARYMLSHIPEVGAVASRGVGELGLVKSWVLFEDQSVSALKAFKKIIEHRVSGIAITDAQGRIAYNFSTRIILRLTPASLRLIALPIPDFLRKVFPDFETSPNITQAITCHEADPLQYVLRRLEDNNVHRVWVQDDRAKPIGIVSMTDICKACFD